MYCPNCNKEFDSKFCPDCGIKLVEKATSKVEYNTKVGVFETGKKDALGGAYEGNRFLALRDRKLETYQVKDGVEIIGDRAFYDAKVERVVLPDSLKVIGQSAFAGCKHLADINIPEGVELIKETAFRDCTSLTEITLPATLLKVEKRAFGPALKRLIVLSENTLFDLDAFRQVKELEEILMPASVVRKYAVMFEAIGLKAQVSALVEEDETYTECEDVEYIEPEDVEDTEPEDVDDVQPTENNSTIMENSEMNPMNFFEFVSKLTISYDYYLEEDYDEDSEDYQSNRLELSTMDDEEVERFLDYVTWYGDIPEEAIWEMVDYDGDLEREDPKELQNEQEGMAILAQYPEAFAKAAHMIFCEEEGCDCDEAIYGVGGYFWWGDDAEEEEFFVDAIEFNQEDEGEE